MTVRKAIGQAVALFESFRERKPQRMGTLRFKVPKAVACMGYVEGVDYRTTHGKKLTLYHHDFAPGSRPLLCVSADGKQLLLVGGRYQWTARGIVDKDAKGRDVENAGHGKTINPRRKRNMRANAEEIIRRHYKLKGKMSAQDVREEIADLMRRAKHGLLSDNQSALYDALDLAGHDATGAYKAALLGA